MQTESLAENQIVTIIYYLWKRNKTKKNPISWIYSVIYCMGIMSTFFWICAARNKGIETHQRTVEGPWASQEHRGVVVRTASAVAMSWMGVCNISKWCQKIPAPKLSEEYIAG